MRRACRTTSLAACLLIPLALAAHGGEGLTLTSPSVMPGRAIPVKFTCQGANVSPQLDWSHAPTATKSFAVIVDDPDAPAGTWVHWVIFNLPSNSTGLPEGASAAEQLADGARNGRNDFKRLGYGGPCPPPGPAHRYYFRLYALDRTLDLPAGASRADVERAMTGHVLAQAELMGTFQR